MNCSVILLFMESTGDLKMFSTEESCSPIPIRILLAEDNICSQELTLRMLKYMGLYADV